MSYEPQPGSKVSLLLEAMRAAADKPVWTQDEAARSMGVPRSMVPTYVAACCNHKLLFRRMGQGGIDLSLQPFPAELEIPRFDGHARAPSPQSSATVVGYVPPPMMAPRPGSDVRHVNPPAPASQEIDPRFAEAHYGHDLYVGERPGDGMVVTGPVEATFTSEELEQLHGETDAQPEEEEAEVVEEPDAWVSCRTGTIVVTGVPQEEDGSFILPAELVQRIKRQIAWSPAP
jgi:hypothetical protein